MQYQLVRHYVILIKIFIISFFSRKLRLTKALHFHQLMTDAKDLVAFTKTPERNEADITILLKKYDEIIGEVKNYENTIKSLNNKENSVKRSNSALGQTIV